MFNQSATPIFPFSFPKRHVRNAQRQLKMLQRRQQQDTEGSQAGSVADEDTDSVSGTVPHSTTTNGVYQSNPYVVPHPQHFSPTAMTV